MKLCFGGRGRRCVPCVILSPYLVLKLAITSDQLKISAVRCDQPCAVRARRQRYQHVKMQITELFRRKTFVGTDPVKYPTGLQPVLLRWSQDGMVFLQLSQKRPFSRLGRSAPEFSQHHRRCPYKAGYGFNPFLVTPGTQVVDKYGCIKNNEAIHPAP